MEFEDRLRNFLLMLVPFLFSLSFHEMAHAWMANRKGDSTARLLGRLTLNPVPHMDLIGTVIFPLLIFLGGIPIPFAWAKPVPVNGNNLTNYRADMFWISIAGPISNLLLATISSFFLVIIGKHVPKETLGLIHEPLSQILAISTQFNLMLAFFNLIPIPPLDGAAVLSRFLPARHAYALEQLGMYSFIILIILSFLGVFKYLFIPISLSYNFLIILFNFLL